MPDINDLLADALETEAHGTLVWAARDEIYHDVARSVSRRRRTRAIATTGIAAASLVALSAAAFAAVHVGENQPITMPTTAVTSSSPSAPASASATPSPTPTPPTILDWATVPEDDKPAWSPDSAAGEPASRIMAPWVWDYVTDEWTLEVYADPGQQWPSMKSQALLLRAPNDDLFRIASLPTDKEATVSAANPSERIAWLDLFEGGDSWQTVEVDLASGTIDENWLPAELADPYANGWFDGVWDVARVAKLDGGRELWANFTYLQTYDGFFIRETDGTWTAMAGMEEAKAAVASGSVNLGNNAGIEAWYDAGSQSVAILFQWGAYNDDGSVFNVSKAQWVVAKLGSSGSSSGDQTRISEEFVPTTGLCGSGDTLGATNPDASAPAGFTVTTSNGTTWWELTPLTADATALGDVG